MLSGVCTENFEEHLEICFTEEIEGKEWAERDQESPSVGLLP